MKSYDSFALWSYKQYGESNEYKFHFPLEGVHEDKYCKDFVECIRGDIREPKYNKSKMEYLVTYRQKNDKSKFIRGSGYSEYNLNSLFYDICLNTNRNSINFSRFSHGDVLLTAQTILKGKETTTVWKLEKSLHVNFVTLIPGGYKHGKD